MNTPLNDDTQQRARKLARTITVAHDLDPEIQEELYGHIEDKLLAYKSGEEPVSDEDAFILVREHFGDAQRLRRELQLTHLGAVQSGLFRRLIALAVATLGFYIATGIFGGLVRVMAAELLMESDALKRMSVLVLLYHLEFPIVLAGLLVVLHRWRSAMRRGDSPWFCHWPLPRMVVLFVALAVVRFAIPTILLVGAEMKKPAPIELMATYTLIIMPVVGLCIIWLWWSDARNLAVRPLLGFGAAWIAFALAIQNNLQYFVINIPSIVDFQIRWMTLASGHNGGLDWSWHLNLEWTFWRGGPFTLGAGAHILCLFILFILFRAASGSTRPPSVGINTLSSR